MNSSCQNNGYVRIARGIIARRGDWLLEAATGPAWAAILDPMKSRLHSTSPGPAEGKKEDEALFWLAEPPPPSSDPPEHIWQEPRARYAALPQRVRTLPFQPSHPANFQPESSVRGVDVVRVPAPLNNCRGYSRPLPSTMKSWAQRTWTQSLGTGRIGWNWDCQRLSLSLSLSFSLVAADDRRTRAHLHFAFTATSGDY